MPDLQYQVLFLAAALVAVLMKTSQLSGFVKATSSRIDDIVIAGSDDCCFHKAEDDEDDDEEEAQSW